MDRPEPGGATEAASTDRGILLIGAAIATLLLVTVAVVLLAGSRGPAELEPGSPEAALHDYLAAYEDGDLEAAHALLSAELRAEWPLEDYRRSVDAHGPIPGADPARRVLFDRSDVDGEEARIYLTVEEFSGDGLSGDVYRYERAVRLVREDGAWRVDEPLAGIDRIPTTIP